MKRTLLSLLAAAIVLSACAEQSAPATERYLDPEGLFSISIPAGRDVEVIPPDESISSAVTVYPPAPSAGGGLGRFGATGEDTKERVAYSVLAFDNAAASPSGQPASADELAQAFLDSVPGHKVVAGDTITLAGHPARVTVFTFEAQGTELTAAIAATTTDTTGYILRALFLPGEWKNQKQGFQNLAGSFVPTAPPGLRALVPPEPSPSPEPSPAG